MISKLLSKFISKIKKEPYQVDEAITFFTIFSIVWNKGVMLLRGFWHKLWFKKSKGNIFIGKRVKIINHRKIKIIGNAIIEDGCMINALSKNGITIKNNFSIGRNSIIECTGVIREIGEELIIEENVGIAANAFIAVRGKVKIGRNTIVGPGVSIHAENHKFEDLETPIRLQGATREGVISHFP